MNDYMMRIQYTLLICILKAFFMIVSLTLIPFAYVIGIMDKIRNLTSAKSNYERIVNNLLFIPLGIPILILNFINELRCFWINNFRTNL